MRKAIKRVITVAMLVAALIGLASLPASAATGDWHGATNTSELGLNVEISYKDTRNGVSVEGVWIHKEDPAAVTYTLKAYDGYGYVLYETQIAAGYGDDCVGTPYEEIPYPNVEGNFRARAVIVEVSYFGYHSQYGYVSDSVSVTAVRGG